MIILKVLDFFKYIEIKKRYDVFYAKVSILTVEKFCGQKNSPPFQGGVPQSGEVVPLQVVVTQNM